MIPVAGWKPHKHAVRWVGFPNAPLNHNNMQTSDSIKEICTALIGFHKEVSAIPKDANNPFFKSKYASLSGILEAIQKPLTNNGLALLQFPEAESSLTTRLVHTSGEWMEATYNMPSAKATPQDRGSAMTYQRRYAVTAVLSLNIDDDDDGNKASGQQVKQQPQQVQITIDELQTEINKCMSKNAVNTLYAKHKAVVDNNQAMKNALKKRTAQLTP